MRTLLVEEGSKKPTVWSEGEETVVNEDSKKAPKQQTSPRKRSLKKNILVQEDIISLQQRKNKKQGVVIDIEMNYDLDIEKAMARRTRIQQKNSRGSGKECSSW